MHTFRNRGFSLLFVLWLVQRRLPLVLALLVILLVLCNLRSAPRDHSKKEDVVNTDMTDLYMRDTTQDISYNSASLNTSTDAPRKVIFLTYMRSGSTFLGELSRQNTDHMFWFEPADGMYSHLYAAALGWYPLDITHFVDGTQRVLPQYERDLLKQSIQGMLDCDFEKVPLEVLSSDSMFKPRHRHMTKYVACMKKVFTGSDDRGRYGYNSLNSCKRPMRFICPRRFTTAPQDRLKLCYFKVHKHSNHTRHSDTLNNNDIMNEETSNWKEFFEKKTGKKMKTKMTSFHEEVLSQLQNEQFANHESCLEPFKRRQQKCVEHLYDRCKTSDARVLKVIRLTMDTIQDLLETDPSIQIVHLLRDPRAIVHSRVGMLISGVAKFLSNPRNMEERKLEEAKLLCQKLMHDINLRKKLEQKYKNNFLELRYEELAMKPIDTYKRVYSFLGLKRSGKVQRWVELNTHAATEGKKFSTARRNSTETAFSWEEGVTYRLVKNMNRVCKDVLKYLGYS